jgi:hypothetical protein
MRGPLRDHRYNAGTAPLLSRVEKLLIDVDAALCALDATRPNRRWRPK